MVSGVYTAVHQRPASWLSQEWVCVPTAHAAALPGEEFAHGLLNSELMPMQRALSLCEWAAVWLLTGGCGAARAGEFPACCAVAVAWLEQESSQQIDHRPRQTSPMNTKITVTDGWGIKQPPNLEV